MNVNLYRCSLRIVDFYSIRTHEQSPVFIERRVKLSSALCGCLGGGEGAIAFSVQLDRAAFVCGQIAHVSTDVHNQSSQQVTGSRVVLEQVCALSTCSSNVLICTFVSVHTSTCILIVIYILTAFADSGAARCEAVAEGVSPTV